MSAIAARCAGCTLPAGETRGWARRTIAAATASGCRRRSPSTADRRCSVRWALGLAGGGSLPASQPISPGSRWILAESRRRRRLRDGPEGSRLPRESRPRLRRCLLRRGPGRCRARERPPRPARQTDHPILGRQALQRRQQLSARLAGSVGSGGGARETTGCGFAGKLAKSHQYDPGNHASARRARFAMREHRRKHLSNSDTDSPPPSPSHVAIVSGAGPRESC
jgi:hypothetical protein